MQAFSNSAGLELLAMLQHAPPARPQQAPPQQTPQHPTRPAAPLKLAQPTANAMPAVFPAPTEPSTEANASLHLMSLLGISGATGAPPAKQQTQQPPQAQQQRAQSEEPEEEQIVFGGFFAKQQAAARPPVVPKAAPSPEKKNNVAPSSALFKSRGQRPVSGEVSTIRKANERGPMVRLAKGPDGTIGFHAGRTAAGLPVVYIGTPSTRSTSPPSPRRSMDAPQDGVRGNSAKKNRKNDPFHRGTNHNSGFQQHRSPLKSCGNTGRDSGDNWRPSQPVFA